MLNWDQFDYLTFDCYGTLIDWETGICQAVRPVLMANSAEDISDDKILQAFARHERHCELVLTPQSQPPLLYKEIMVLVMYGMAQDFGLTLTLAELLTLRESVANWPTFHDSVTALRALKQRYKLGILSNIDDQLFAASTRKLGVEFDLVVTAEQVGSYKPTHRNFETLLQRVDVPRERVLHVAESLHHDIAPANALGMRSVWVNRRLAGHTARASGDGAGQPDLEVPDLQTLVQQIEQQTE